jgi:uncharacterized protein
VGVVDDHAHPFGLAATELSFADITLDVGTDFGAAARRAALAPGRLALEAMRVRLATLLRCAPEDVETARADRAEDWAGYVRLLFADVGLAAMLLDPGVEQLEADDVDAYARLLDRPVGRLLRVEQVIDPALERGATADEILADVEASISAAAAAGFAGAKTVLAYRTGLGVDPQVTLAEARRSVADSAGQPVRRRAKPLRDLLFRRVVAQCGELGLPVQVHTGFGDSELRLTDSEPIALDAALRTPEVSRGCVVLIHAGYPWHEQVAYLAAVRRSVWAEFSLSNLVSPITTADRLMRLLDLAPAGRVLLGSDGHGPPETHWFGLGVLRDAWREIATRLGPVVRAQWLDDVETAVFAGNATALYGLPAGPSN